MAPLLAHWAVLPVALKAVHSGDCDPVGLEKVDLEKAVHASVVLWAIPLPPHLHLPMYPEEPCSRKVSAHLSK